MSWSRARSRPRYSSSLASRESAWTMVARSSSASIVWRNPRTSAGSGFQSTYSGGSKAGNRFTSRESFLELAEEPGGSRRRHPGERIAEFERRGVPIVGIRLQRLDQRPLHDFRDIGPELADGLRLAAQPGDHHLLRVAAVE